MIHMNTKAATLSESLSDERVWDSSTNNKDLINSWVEQERIRVADGGAEFLHGDELESFRIAAAMMPPRLF